MPNQPKTPMHAFRISDEDWNAGKAAAERLGTNLAEELRRAVKRVVKRAEKAE